jgi:iron(III) transport system permease protein
VLVRVREMAKRARLSASPSLAVLAILVTGLIVYVLVNVVRLVFTANGRPSLESFRQAAAEPGLSSVLVDTVLVIGVASVIAVAVGTVLAWIAERTDAGLGSATRLIPLVPVLLPSIAGTIGWVLLLAPRAGYLSTLFRLPPGLSVFSLWGIILVTALFLTPYVFLPVSAAFRNVDSSIEEASLVAGRGPLATFVRVSVPSVWPSILAGASIALMLGLALFSVPSIIGPSAHVTVLAVLIYQVVAIDAPSRPGEALVLSLAAVIVIQLAVALAARASSSRRFVSIGGRANAGQPIRTRRLKWPLRIIQIAFLVISGLLPVAALAVVSVQPYWSGNVQFSKLTWSAYSTLFQNSTLEQPLINSVIISLTATVTVVIVSLLIAYWLRRRRRPIVNPFIRFWITMPSTIPQLIVGLAFLVTFSAPPLILYGSRTLIWLAFVIIFLPQSVGVATSAFSQLGQDVVDAARVSGSGEWRALFTVVLPLVVPTAVGGGLFVFALMMGEVNASILLAGPSTPVIGPTLYNLFNTGTLPPVAALSLCVLVINAVAIVIGSRLTATRRMRRVHTPRQRRQQPVIKEERHVVLS